MKRTRKSKLKKVDAILTADFHLRNDVPICRTDDFVEAQWRKVDFVRALQKEYDCPVLHAGDLFNHWKPSPFLLTMTIRHLPDQFYSIYGNHDLPQHNILRGEKSGLHTLWESGKVKLLSGTHWETEFKKEDVLLLSGKTVLLRHLMTWVGKLPWPDCKDPQAGYVLKKNQVDLLLTGHNHQAFTVQDGKRLLVNPGALTRQTADKDEDSPRVYLWHAESNTVTPVYLPYEEGVVSRKHIDRIDVRSSRISAFVERLQQDWDVGIAFEENMETFLSTNNIHPSIIQIVRDVMDDAIVE